MSVTFLTNEDREDLEKSLLPKPTGKAEVGQYVVVRSVNEAGEVVSTETVASSSSPSSGNVNQGSFVVQDAAPEDTSVLWVDPDDNYDDGVVAITGAKVGQTVKISEVDENGVPIAWEPVDFPEGGSSGGKDYVLTDADKTEMVNAVLSALPTWTGGSY